MSENGLDGTKNGSIDGVKTEISDEAPQAKPGVPKRLRGFAAMDRKFVSEIAAKGGRAAHAAGTAHEFTPTEAQIAGRLGGRATHAKRRSAKVSGEDSK